MGSQTYDSFILTGYYTRPQIVHRRTALDQLIIRFSPLGIQWLLDFPLHEITNDFANLPLIFGHRAGALEEALHRTTGPADRIRLLESFLLEKLAAGAPPDTRTLRCIRLLQQQQGRLSLSGAARELAVGERTLQRIVHNGVGCNFKLFSRLLRFQAGVREMHRGGPGLKLTSLAYDLGYFDQAHFVHDFRTLSGLNPRRYLQQQTDPLYNAPNRIR